MIAAAWIDMISPRLNYHPDTLRAYSRTVFRLLHRPRSWELIPGMLGVTATPLASTDTR